MRSASTVFKSHHIAPHKTGYVLEQTVNFAGIDNALSDNAGSENTWSSGRPATHADALSPCSKEFAVGGSSALHVEDLQNTAQHSFH